MKEQQSSGLDGFTREFAKTSYSDKIFENHVSKKRLISRLHKKLPNLTVKQKPNGSWAKHMKKHLPKMT